MSLDFGGGRIVADLQALLVQGKLLRYRVAKGFEKGFPNARGFPAL